MSVSMISLMLQSSAINSAAISGSSMKQAELLGKSRVVLKKFASMPRLELNAAVLSVKMTCLLKIQLMLENVKEWFWTDSRAVVDYIKNDSRKFKTFVANSYNRSERILTCSNGAMFQQEKTLLMVPLEV